MKPEQTIYLDYNATTPVAKEVADAILPYLREQFGNPSSSHSIGQQARAAVELAREQVADLLGCSPSDIIFTGGGSEANNQVIRGVAEMLAHKGRHMITSAIEHPAVLKPCEWLESRGYEITRVPVDEYGRVAPADVEAALRDDTILVTIMHANNEVGAIQPIAEIARIAHARDVLVHTDAAQTVGKIPTDVKELGVDFLSVAGHKLYATKGIGALFLRAGIDLPPLIHGAGHESGRRAGTENVPEIVGLGRACHLAKSLIPQYAGEIRPLRDLLHQLLVDFPGQVALNGHPEARLPNTLNLSFLGLDSHKLLEAVPGLAASTGSACHAGSHEPSPVLTAMGLPAGRAIGAVRFSLGKDTTSDEIGTAARWIGEASQELRA